MLEVKNITAAYPGSEVAGGFHPVLRNVSFTIADGERVALIGANGAGKSTLLQAVVGLVPLHEGEIIINGRKLAKNTLAECRRDAALLFQNPDSQLFMSSVREDVLFGPLNYLHDGNKAEKAAREALRSLGIEHLADKMPHKLSGGEKRLAALAAVLAAGPKILLADEPTAFLDPRATRRLSAALAPLSHTIIIATHDFAFARAETSRAILLCEGSIAACGPTAAILDDAALLDRSLL